MNEVGDVARKSAVILLVEDDPADQLLIQRVLREGSINHVLHVANDGEEALNYLCRKGEFQDKEKYRTPDLILLDLNMPKVDGIEVLETIRVEPDLRLIPVIVLTTSNEKKDMHKCYELGAKSFITKPMDLDLLNKTIKTIEDYWFSIVSLPEDNP